MLSKVLARISFLMALLASPGVTALADTSSLSMQIAVTPENSRLAYKDSASHFHVVLENTSAAPLRVWEDWNSWGYFALSFEVSDENGNRWVASKSKQIKFTRNFPSFETLDPRRPYVLDVYFGDAREWEGFPLRKGEEHAVSVRAVFEIRESPEATKQNVWVGRVVSDVVRVTFVK